MPSKSEAQARLMAAAAHNREFAKKVGVPQHVAKDFNKADTGTKRLSDAMKEENEQEEVFEMDSQGYKGSREDDIDWSKPQHHTKKVADPKKVAVDAKKILDKSFNNAYKKKETDLDEVTIDEQPRASDTTIDANFVTDGKKKKKIEESQALINKYIKSVGWNPNTISKNQMQHFLQSKAYRTWLSAHGMEEEYVIEGKMGELHADIGRLMNRHIENYRKLGGDDYLGHHAAEAGDAIAKIHNIKPEHAHHFVHQYITDKLGVKNEGVENEWQTETPWKKTPKDDVIDKSGAKHTVASRVRHLARQALQKTVSDGKKKVNETLGMAGTGSEDTGSYKDNVDIGDVLGALHKAREAREKGKPHIYWDHIKLLRDKHARKSVGGSHHTTHIHQMVKKMDAETAKMASEALDDSQSATNEIPNVPWGADPVSKRSNRTKLVKKILRKEDTYPGKIADDNKYNGTIPKIQKGEASQTGAKEQKALITVSGGSTMTKKPRDTIEIDMQMRKPKHGGQTGQNDK